MKRVLICGVTLLLLSSAAAFSATKPLLRPQDVIRLAHAPDARASFASAQWIPRSHKILYVETDPEGAPRVYIYDVDRGTRILLLDGYDPLISPDGKNLIYFTDSPEKRSLWMATSDGLGKRSLNIVSAENLSWSPDSKLLAYIAPISSERQPEPTYAVHVLDSRTGHDRIAFLKSGGFISMLGWIDVATLFYDIGIPSLNTGSSPADGRAEVRTFSLRSEREKVLLPSFYGNQPTQFPSLDPSRRFLAFYDDSIKDRWGDSWYPWKRNFEVFDMQSGHVMALTNASDKPGCGTWINSGAILYDSGTSTKQILSAIDIRSGKRIFLSNLPVQTLCRVPSDPVLRYPAVSSDARYILWLVSTPYAAIELWDARTDGTRMRRLATLETPLRDIAASRIVPVSWKSYDGLSIDGYLGYPLAHRTNKRYPLVVIVHGGPQTRLNSNLDEWPGGALFIQLLTARGYAVFLPDYRESGSFGFDKILQARAEGQLFRPIFNDIMSGVNFLEKDKIADPRRVYIIGHSYGSEITNWVITHTHRFKAAVSYEGSDYYYDWGGPWGWNGASVWRLRSTPLDNLSLYLANSAVANAAYLQTPTLFINAEKGFNEPSLAWLYAAERSRHIPTEYVLYRGESHVIQKPENQLDLLSRILKWLN